MNSPRMLRSGSPPIRRIGYPSGSVQVGDIRFFPTDPGPGWVPTLSDPAGPGVIPWPFDTAQAPLCSAHGNGVWVVINAIGDLLRTTDFKTWTKPASFASIKFGVNNLKFINDKFWAVGADGKIATSVDGENWISFTIGTAHALNCIEYANSVYVIGTSNGANALVFRSTTGASGSWTGVLVGGSSVRVYGLAFGVSKWVAVLETGRVSTGTADASSFAGQTQIAGNQFYDVTFAKDKFIAVGLQQAKASVTGASWVDIATPFTSDPGPIRKIKFFDDRFWIGGGNSIGQPGTGGKIYYSAAGDDSNWSQIPMALSNNSVLDFATDGKSLLICADGSAPALRQAYVSKAVNTLLAGGRAYMRVA